MVLTDDRRTADGIRTNSVSPNTTANPLNGLDFSARSPQADRVEQALADALADRPGTTVYKNARARIPHPAYPVKPLTARSAQVGHSPADPAEGNPMKVSMKIDSEFVSTVIDAMYLALDACDTATGNTIANPDVRVGDDKIWQYTTYSGCGQYTLDHSGVLTFVGSRRSFEGGCTAFLVTPASLIIYEFDVATDSRDDGEPGEVYHTEGSIEIPLEITSWESTVPGNPGPFEDWEARLQEEIELESQEEGWQMQEKLIL